MATHYISNESSGSQYYFNNANATTSHSYGNYSSPVTSTYGSSVYSAYPVNISSISNQQVRLDNSYHAPQQYQSVAGFNKSLVQHDYNTSHSSTPQVRATVRAVTSQDLYTVQRSPQPVLVSPQQHHFQFDNRQQPGHPTGPAVVYQTPGAAQFTHRNVDLWTESPSQNPDHYVQAQQVSVRSVSTASPQQSHSVSPQRHQDQLQKYYSQLTPEQHQQLLRNQQLQRQREPNSHYEQQHHVTAQQVSPSPHHHYEQHRSTSGFDGGHNNQQRRVRSESERQQQDEQDYYAAQSKLAAQRVQQQQADPNSHPVGIRNLMNKFTGPATPTQPRSKSTSTRHYSSSNQTFKSGSRPAAAHSLTTYSMTYSSLPKPYEPPVNSVEYYQMQMQNQGATPFTSIQQAAAPTHIQHAATGIGGLRDRFTTGSHTNNLSQPEIVNQQQRQPASTANGGNSLSSIRNQYINQAKQSSYEPSPVQQVQKISRTIIGEDLPQLQQAPQASVYQPPVQQQKPITSQTLSQQQTVPQTASQSQQQQPKPQATPHPQQSTTQTAPQQQEQESAPQIPAQQQQAVVLQTPAKQEEESAPQTPAQQEQQPTPENSSPTEQEPTPETPPQQQQVEPTVETPKQQPEPIAEASKQQPEDTTQTPKPKTETTSQTPKPKTEATSQATKQQATSPASTTKKEPAKTTTKAADKKSSPS